MKSSAWVHYTMGTSNRGKHCSNEHELYGRSQVDERDHDVLSTEAAMVIDNLRHNWDNPCLLDFQALAAEIPPAFEIPAIIRARPHRDGLNELLQLRVDVRPEGRKPLHPIEEARFDLLVVVCGPFERFIESKAELVHDNGEDVVLVIASGLLLIVGSKILRDT